MRNKHWGYAALAVSWMNAVVGCAYLKGEEYAPTQTNIYDIGEIDVAPDTLSNGDIYFKFRNGDAEIEIPGRVSPPLDPDHPLYDVLSQLNARFMVLSDWDVSEIDLEKMKTDPEYRDSVRREILETPEMQAYIEEQRENGRDVGELKLRGERLYFEPEGSGDERVLDAYGKAYEIESGYMR